MKELENFGKNVCFYRKLRGLSQDKLAELIGYKGRASISKIESGDRDICCTSIQKIANALQVSPSDLLLTDNAEAEKKLVEFLPYLAKADEVTLNNIRKMLDMPVKKQNLGSTEMVG